MKKEHGKFLSTVLILGLILNCLLILVNANPKFIAADSHHYAYPVWFQIYLILTRIVAIGALLVIMNWKKIGVYIIAVLPITLVVPLVELFSYWKGPLNLMIVINELGLTFILLIVTVWAVFRKWKYFD